jgi:hypothetical protein
MDIIINNSAIHSQQVAQFVYFCLDQIRVIQQNAFVFILLFTYYLHTVRTLTKPVAQI